jgi:RHS repeat-associated protein
LDYFLARYYSSTQGRFTSPDEFTGGPDELFIFADAASANPTFYADLTNPQSLNKYQYTYNNPLRYTDPDGHCPVCPSYYYEYYVKPAVQQVDAKITQIKTDLVDYGKGLGKSVANTVIDMANAGATITGAEPHARYEPSNEVQAMAMDSGDKLILLSGGLGKGAPVNVATAEGKGAAATGGHLVRFGKGPETVSQLAADAARAEAAGFPHGVSTMLVNRVSGSDKAHRSAAAGEVQNHFKVEQTGRNPNHHTVHLPKPVTSEVADKFNKVFKPKE